MCTPADPVLVAHWPWLAASVLAATMPTLVAFNQPPSATLLNQCLAVAMWGGVAVLLPPGRWVRGSGPLPAALALVAAGTPIGPLATQIAAHALALDAALVTHNIREFTGVRGLLLSDWVAV